MKMKTPEMSVVRFDEEDILTASGDTTRWSLGSWKASYYDTVVTDNNAFKAGTNSKWVSPSPIADGNYNYVDGTGYSDVDGEIFTIDEFYHFDLDSTTKANRYWNWKTCTDESHHYLVDPGK